MNETVTEHQNVVKRNRRKPPANSLELWQRILTMLNSSPEPGKLLHATGEAFTIGDMSRMVGLDFDRTAFLVMELKNAGHLEINDGVYQNREILKKERKRRLCAEAGRRGGGNPALKRKTHQTDDYAQQSVVCDEVSADERNKSGTPRPVASAVVLDTNIPVIVPDETTMNADTLKFSGLPVLPEKSADKPHVGNYSFTFIGQPPKPALTFIGQPPSPYSFLSSIRTYTSKKEFLKSETCLVRECEAQKDLGEILQAKSVDGPNPEMLPDGNSASPTTELSNSSSEQRVSVQSQDTKPAKTFDAVRERVNEQQVSKRERQNAQDGLLFAMKSQPVKRKRSEKQQEWDTLSRLIRQICEICKFVMPESEIKKCVPVDFSRYVKAGKKLVAEKNATEGQLEHFKIFLGKKTKARKAAGKPIAQYMPEWIITEWDEAMKWRNPTNQVNGVNAHLLVTIPSLSQVVAEHIAAHSRFLEVLGKPIAAGVKFSHPVITKIGLAGGIHQCQRTNEEIERLVEKVYEFSVSQWKGEVVFGNQR